MARICGICKLPPREGQEMGAIRLRTDDIQEAAIKPGCYQACIECITKYTPIIEARLRATGELEDGQPMTSQWLL